MSWLLCSSGLPCHRSALSNEPGKHANHVGKRHCRDVAQYIHRHFIYLTTADWISRRKKSRCPGERPACSHCSRLGQVCHYSEDLERSNPNSGPQTSGPGTPPAQWRHVSVQQNRNDIRMGTTPTQDIPPQDALVSPQPRPLEASGLRYGGHVVSI